MTTEQKAFEAATVVARTLYLHFSRGHSKVMWDAAIAYERERCAQERAEYREALSFCAASLNSETAQRVLEKWRKPDEMSHQRAIREGGE